MTRRPAHSEHETSVFWSVFEARHGLRQPETRRPAMTDANGDTAEPLPSADQPEERE